jgi:hypothetical protein
VANEQQWEKYVSDDTLEKYIDTFTQMLRRFQEKGIHDQAYVAKVRASLARLNAELESRTG